MIRKVIHIFFIFLLSACTTKVRPIHKYNNPYKFSENSTVLMMGVINGMGLKKIGFYNNETLQSYRIDNTTDSNFQVFAWEINTNTKIKLQSLHYDVGGGRNDSVLAHTIVLRKPAIYYYGTVLVNNNESVLIKKPLDKIINLAKSKYPFVFNELELINFK